MVNVLFVCLGNICRSPMAEAVFRHLVLESGLADKIKIDSAGTASYHAGESAHRGTLQILQKHGIVHKGRSRQLTHDDFYEYDYILAMDRSNLRNIRALIPDDSEATVAMFLDYANGLKTREVPDPYYNGRFDEVYDLVTKGAAGLLAAIRENHGI